MTSTAASTAAAIATCVKLAKNCATAEPEAFHVDDALPLTVHSKGTKGRHKGMVLQGVERRRGGNAVQIFGTCRAERAPTE